MLLILLANGAGFYVYYVIQLQQIHQEMRTRLKYLPDSELEVLVLTRAQYEEAKVEEHEVKVEGKMYDIARVQTSGDVVKIFCLHDEKEDDLLALLAELISKPMKDQSSIPLAVMTFITMSFILQDNDFQLNSDFVVVDFCTNYLLTSGINGQEVTTPPPRA